jgi:hypothetical protein
MEMVDSFQWGPKTSTTSLSREQAQQVVEEEWKPLFSRFACSVAHAKVICGDALNNSMMDLNDWVTIARSNY